MHCGKHINTNTETTSLCPRTVLMLETRTEDRKAAEKNPINHEKIIKKSWMLAINQSGI